MKKPLIGSATLTRNTRLATSVASALAPARCLLKLSALPPALPLDVFSGCRYIVHGRQTAVSRDLRRQSFRQFHALRGEAVRNVNTQLIRIACHRPRNASQHALPTDRKSTRLNSSHLGISY